MNGCIQHSAEDYEQQNLSGGRQNIVKDRAGFKTTSLIQRRISVKKALFDYIDGWSYQQNSQKARKRCVQTNPKKVSTSSPIDLERILKVLTSVWDGLN